MATDVAVFICQAEGRVATFHLEKAAVIHLHTTSFLKVLHGCPFFGERSLLVVLPVAVVLAAVQIVIHSTVVHVHQSTLDGIGGRLKETIAGLLFQPKLQGVDVVPLG